MTINDEKRATSPPAPVPSPIHSSRLIPNKFPQMPCPASTLLPTHSLLEINTNDLNLSAVLSALYCGLQSLLLQLGALFGTILIKKRELSVWEGG